MAYARGTYAARPAIAGISDVAAALARKERVELYLKIAAVGVAGVGALGLLVYALRS